MESDRHRQEQQVWQQEAWKLRVSGWTQQRIAEHLGVSQPRVSQILKKIEAKLHAEFVDEAAEIKARQTAQLEHVYTEALYQWLRSCEDLERTTVVSGRAGVSAVMGVIDLPNLETTMKEGQSGNPALLAQAMKALADIRAIWGLEAPKKQELSGPDGGAIRVTEIVVEIPRGDHDD